MKTKSETDQYPAHIILFDGQCNFCNRYVNFLIKKDKSKKFHFASLQSHIAQKLMSQPQLKLEENTSNTVVYIKHRRVFTRSRAILEILRDLGGVYKAFYPFVIVPRPLRDAVYRLVAKYRHKIAGRRSSCAVPTPEFKSRFLDRDEWTNS